MLTLDFLFEAGDQSLEPDIIQVVCVPLRDLVELELHAEFHFYLRLYNICKDSII
jgi:hypothetical protein